jgi:uncharacterized protein with PQ loop repeat
MSPGVPPAVLVLGFIAGTLGVASQWPQFLRLARTRVGTGVSITSQILGLACVGLWFSHGLFSRDAAQTMSNAAAMIAAAGIVVVLITLRATRREQLVAVVGTLACAAAIVTLAWIDRPAIVTAVAVSVSMMRLVPQLLIAVRPGRSMAGLAPLTLAITVTCSMLWAAYGLLVGDPAVILTSSVGLLLNSFISYRRVPPAKMMAAARAGRFGPAAARVVTPGKRVMAKPVPVVAPAPRGNARPVGVPGGRRPATRPSFARRDGRAGRRERRPAR